MRSTVTRFVIAIGAIGLAVVIAGFAPAVSDSQRSLIERGRHLVKITGCNDCHTPGYPEAAGHIDEQAWLTGSPVGWQGAWGTSYPINLRLFMQNISEEQWLITARNVQALPPMPWFALRDMSDQDLRSIYQYVRSLGPAGEPAPVALPPGAAAQTPVVTFPK